MREGRLDYEYAVVCGLIILVLLLVMLLAGVPRPVALRCPFIQPSCPCWMWGEAC